MKIIKNVDIYDFKNYAPNHFVAFEDKIIKKDSMECYDSYIDSLGESSIEYEIVDGKNALLLPGLTLGHSHIYSTFARGWITPFAPTTFQDILDQLWWKLDGELGEEEIYYSGLASATAYLKQGITTVIDHHASGKMILGSLDTLKNAVVDEMGLRGIFCFETSDRFNIKECLDENTNFYHQMKRNKSADCSGLLGLHASFTLSDETLIELSKTPMDMPLHVHIAESIEDVQWTREHCGCSILERFEQFNLLRKDNIYVHGVHMDTCDFGKIKKTEGYMAINPSSNMNNGVGLPPIDKIIEEKIPWFVGNDGLGFGLSRDYQTVIYTSNLQRSKYFYLDALRKSIITGYDYAGTQLGCKLGRIEQGYEADMIIIDYDSITPITEENIFGHFVYGVLEQMNPKQLWTKGKQRMREYELLEENQTKLQEGKRCAEKLWKKLK